MSTPPSSPRLYTIHFLDGPPVYPQTAEQLMDSLSNKLRRYGVSERVVKILREEEFDEEALMYIIENPYPSDIEFWNNMKVPEHYLDNVLNIVALEKIGPPAEVERLKDFDPSLDYLQHD